MPDQDHLFTEFAPISKQEWLDRVIKDLKGRPLDDLQWIINEQLQIPPFFHPEDKIQHTQVYRGPKSQNDWLLGEDFLVEDAVATNKRLLQALMNGVNAPKLIFPELPTAAVLQDVFKDVELAYIHTYLEFKNTTAEPQKMVEIFRDYALTKRYDLPQLKGAFIFAQADYPIEDKLADSLPQFQCCSVNARQISVAPADVVDVLAEILLGLDAWCQQIPERRLAQMQLHLAVGKSYFLEIAKIRAIHLLWANLLDAYGAPLVPLQIDAYLSPTAYDDSSNTNMIRSMTMALSAVIGGVDRLSVLPGDQESTEFTKRIARNVQHLLQLESYMDRVIDPAQGSYYLEALTRRLVELAWGRLQKTSK